MATFPERWIRRVGVSVLFRLCLRRLVLVTLVLGIFVLGIFALGIVVSGPSTAAAAQSPRFVPPVDAPVSDPYRSPTTPYGPGNRGIEYATTFGTDVRASGTGVVAFAGFIAHERYVSIDHEGGIRTTYSYLATIEVVAGQAVGQGEIVGISGARLHFGARRFGAYIDPASLFEAVAPRRARLLPIAGLPWT